MQVILEILAGPHSGQRLTLQSGQSARIGRTEWADIPLEKDRYLSALHFAVECGPGSCRLRDLGSTNGTLLNGRRIADSPLRDGDEIRAGLSRIRVHVEGAVAPRSAPLVPSATAPSQPAAGADAPSTAPAAPVKPSPAPTATVHGTVPLPGVAAGAPIAPPTLLAPPLSQPRIELPARPSVPAPHYLGGRLRVVLEMVAGPSERRSIVLQSGQSVRVGRTEQADVAFPLDMRMSSVHFALECGVDACRLRDLRSTNGTMVNGNRVAEAVLAHGDEIRAGATRFVVNIEGGQAAPADAPRSTAAGLSAALADPDPLVRREALLAAAWTRQPWLWDYCRAQCDRPGAENWDAVLLFAVLAGPRELPRLAALGRAAELGPRRFQALGAYGHPGVVETLLEAVGGADPVAAATAGQAFAKITGADIESDRRVQLPPEGPPPDEFEAEFLDELPAPDAEKARRHWSEVAARFASSTRVCRGFDLSQGAAEEVLDQLDMESRWEAALRARFEGKERGTLADWERFPLPRRQAAR